MVVKQDLYNLLTQKKAELVEAKVKPLREKFQQKRQEVIEAELIKNGVNVDEYITKVNEVAKVASGLRDTFEIYYGDIRDIALCKFDDREHFLRSLVRSVNIDWMQISPELYELSQELKSIENSLDEEFQKLGRLVKVNSAKQSMKIFKELGFDISDIENQTAKKEVMILKVNSDLLDLPEPTAEGDSDEQEGKEEGETGK